MNGTPLRHLPNALSLLRMLLTVPLAWWIGDGRYEAALGLAFVAGVSDALDGFLAKRCGWQSWLGGVIDPLADKLLLTASFVTLAATHAIPAWLAALVVGRDVVIVAGAVVYHNLIGRVTAEPTRLSKFTTFVQIVFVLATLLHLSRWAEWPAWVNATLLWLVVAATLASGIDYVWRWSLRAWRGRRAARAP
ncbi:MAG TPA: CDP-alcohol phosphatidyltransferase family protein [Rhodanobacteraceae bacterium]|nr:CDP-alcohol phosphatidyltransferase family protein [Rhodanobacteraceae bacterium]